VTNYERLREAARQRVDACGIDWDDKRYAEAVEREFNELIDFDSKLQALGYRPVQL
jgi:hypothetical protein